MKIDQSKDSRGEDLEMDEKESLKLPPRHVAMLIALALYQKVIPNYSDPEELTKSMRVSSTQFRLGEVGIKVVVFM